MARRGFFAEIQHQAKIAARERERDQRAAERAHQSAVRRAEQARRAEERTRTQLARSAESDRKRLAEEARDAHLASMEAEVEMRNSDLAEIYEEIDSLLSATLDVDDYVDLETLRIVVNHPPFSRPDLEIPIPCPALIPSPEEPIFTPPQQPSGFRALFGRRSRARALAESESKHERDVAAWREEMESLPLRRQAQVEEHARLEAARIAMLNAERSRYQAERSTRETEALQRNKEVDELIANLGYGAAEAIQEYVSIVLSNSVYPSHFQVSHEFTFEPATAELRLRVLVPSPDAVPSVKVYKYTKSTDEITSVPLSSKTCRERYAGAVQQVAIRSLHEVFEADRRGLIQTISLEVGTETIDPATGRNAYIPFIATAAERVSFLEFDLSGVVPAATLTHLGAAVSRNPFELVAVDTKGVRRS